MTSHIFGSVFFVKARLRPPHRHAHPEHHEEPTAGCYGGQVKNRVRSGHEGAKSLALMIVAQDRPPGKR
jgi:hypothetical protein